MECVMTKVCLTKWKHYVQSSVSWKVVCLQKYKFYCLCLGQIHLPLGSNDFFFLSAFGNSEEGYKFKGSNFVIGSNQNFPSLDLKAGSDPFNYCLRARLATVNSSSKLELVPSNCGMQSGVICKQKPFRCNASTDSDTDWALKLQMDPGTNVINHFWVYIHLGMIS